jgi:hypothetical protein
MEITVPSPLDEGSYVLEFDLLREGKAWFKDGGSQTADIRLDVKKRDWPESTTAFSLEHDHTTRFRSSYPEIERLYRLIRLTLEENEVEFQGKAGPISGFSPGTDYPQIWLRDANTILPASRFFYDTRYLSSWLEEHLAFQQVTGSLYDWIDAQGGSDKNTTETDQEASAVQAAYQIYQVLGPDWLQKDIQGMTILQRLDRALGYILENRTGSVEDSTLISGAHTADWGDVDLVDSGEKAVYTDDRTFWTVDIYDQSMFYQACLFLSEMLDAAGNTDRSSFWDVTAQQLKEASQRLLWQPDKGFFRVHEHLTALKHEFAEEDIFAMGGNTQAILSGLATAEQARSIIETALERQKSFNISTISGTLLPPYPAGTFKHPLLANPFIYQNGAQWDWFGGKIIFAMFTQGFSRQAKSKLLEVIHKNLANGGFFEWDSRAGTGQGSDTFCGGAGSLALAVIQGYFGIMPKKGGYILEPRLAADSARINLYQPADNSFVAYTYDFDPKAQRITFRYNSNVSGEGIIRILSPWDSMPVSLNVTLSGKAIPFDTEKRGEDSYIVFRSGYDNRTVIVQR